MVTPRVFVIVFPGDGRLSQARERPVPLALEVVTVLFGMGNGGVPPLESPGKLGVRSQR